MRRRATAQCGAGKRPGTASPSWRAAANRSLTRRELPGDPDDRQARYIEAAVNGVIVASLYAPNGNPQPGPKFDYKLTWMERLLAHAKELYAAGVPMVLAKIAATLAAQLTAAIKPPAAAQTSTVPNTAPATAAPAPSKP